MIKFLRDIRYNLIERNNLGKYSKYAIGEILLVVIGILIALQINNWNEGNNEKKVEKAYMQNMLEDLHDDLEIYQEFKIKNQYIYQLIDSIIPTIKRIDRKEYTTDLSFWSRMITMEWRIVNPVQRTYEQMKSSGHLRIIKDKKVSDAISNYYNSLSRFDGYNEAAMLWAADYVKSMGKLFDAELLRKIMLKREKQIAGPSALLTEDPIVINEFLNSLQYFNGALVLGEEVSNVEETKATELIDLITNTYYPQSN